MVGADALEYGDRKQFRAMVLASAVGHALVLALLLLSPSFSSPPPGIPGVVVVDLVTMPPGLSPAPAAPAAPKAAPPKPAPKPEATPVPPPKPVEPPKPPPTKTVLPKEAMAKPTPKPTPKPAPKQVDYDELMKELREDAGEERPEAIQQAASGARSDAVPSTLPSGALGGTVKVSPDVMAWIRDTRIHVRKNWVKAPGFEKLETQLLVNLDEAGNVIGEPQVTRRSGNPYYDDSVVRAIQKASPLPKPPRAGEWPFVFPSEES